MGVDDDVETKTPAFTEEEVYWIGGFIARRLGAYKGDREVATATEEAIREVLSLGLPFGR